MTACAECGQRIMPLDTPRVLLSDTFEYLGRSYDYPGIIRGDGEDWMHAACYWRRTYERPGTIAPTAHVPPLRPHPTEATEANQAL